MAKTGGFCHVEAKLKRLHTALEGRFFVGATELADEEAVGFDDDYGLLWKMPCQFALLALLGLHLVLAKIH